MSYIVEQLVNDKYEVVTYKFDQSNDVLRFPVVPGLYLDTLPQAMCMLNILNGGPGIDESGLALLSNIVSEPADDSYPSPVFSK